MLAEPTRPGSSAAPPPLPDAWARLGLVTGVQRWLPAPVPEATLAVDWALACHGAGLTEQARARFAAASASLLSRDEQFLEGELPEAMRPGLLAATHAAAQLLGSQHPDAEELNDRATELEQTASLPEADRTAREDLLAPLLGTAEPAAVQAEPSPRTEALQEATSAWVDPALVPARILRWDGAETPDLLVETHQGRPRITVALADDADPDDQEVTELVARVLDLTTGAVCGSGVFLPAPSDGHRIYADLDVLTPAADPLMQVYQAGRPHPFLDTIRDQELVRVDRLMLEAWALHRLAIAAQALDDLDREILLPRAADRARLAAAALEDLASAWPQQDASASPLQPGLRVAAGHPTREDLLARAEAIRSYHTQLAIASPNLTDQAKDLVTQPLLAEMELLATGTAPIVATAVIRGAETLLAQAAHLVGAQLAPAIDMPPIRLTVPALLRSGYAPEVSINRRVDIDAEMAEITIKLRRTGRSRALTVTLTGPDGVPRKEKIDSTGYATFENVPITSGDLRIRFEPRPEPPSD
ncbi:hypothetical protein ACWC3X_38420 [Streptomyces populi]